MAVVIFEDSSWSTSKRRSIHRYVQKGVQVELHELSLRDVRAGLMRRDFSCREYVRHLTSRAEAADHLNAFTARDPDALVREAQVMDQRRIPQEASYLLGGIPIAVKDNINTAKLPTSAGTSALSGRVPPRDAPVVEALLASGALLAGKTNMHELALGVTSNNYVYGPVRNPWDPSMIAGGSSGGSAVAVAARLVPAALGTDTGASVRLPAALCGVVGFRPTTHRYSGRGVVPVSCSRDVVGPLTRSVEDAAVMDRVLSGEASPLERLSLGDLRLGIPRRPFFDRLHPDVAHASEQAIRALTSGGARLVELDLPNLDAINSRAGLDFVLYELERDLPAYLEECAYGISYDELMSSVVSPDVIAIFARRHSLDLSAESYHRAQQARSELQALYALSFAEHRIDALVFPTSVLPAQPLGQDEYMEALGVRLPTFATYIRNTDPGSNAGIPGVSLPIGLSRSGLPIGLELDGPVHSDRRLLAVALAVEDVLPRMPAPPSLGELEPCTDECAGTAL